MNHFLARYTQCGKFHAAAGGRLSSFAQECVLCAHLETCRGNSFSPDCTLFYDTAPAIYSCDGGNHMELRCLDPAGHHLLMSCRYSGVHPLEQLQHQVSGSVRFTLAAYYFQPLPCHLNVIRLIEFIRFLILC